MTDDTTDKPEPSETSIDEASEAVPGLFSSSPYAILALLAAGTGVVALGSLGLEVATDRGLAKSVDIGVKYISLPLGIATLILSGLTAVERPKWASPSLLLGVVYFLVFLLT